MAPTAHYVMLFAAAIPLWAMQAIVSRAFYAAGDTLTPAVAGTLVTVATMPIYWLFSRLLDTNGLVLASDVGIFMHTAALMLLLPRRLDTVGGATSSPARCAATPSARSRRCRHGRRAPGCRTASSTGTS